jgi:hypothetical protein
MLRKKSKHFATAMRYWAEQENFAKNQSYNDEDIIFSNQQQNRFNDSGAVENYDFNNDELSLPRHMDSWSTDDKTIQLTREVKISNIK